MTIFLLVFNALIVVAGIAILISPNVFFGLLAKYKGTLMIYLAAALVRLVLGIALIIAAPASKFPLVLELLGWFAIAAAAFILLMGRKRFDSLIEWALGLAGKIGRAAGLFAIGFGGFLVYALL